MLNEEKMTVNELRKHLRPVRKRYLKASRLEPGHLLEDAVDSSLVGSASASVRWLSLAPH